MQDLRLIGVHEDGLHLLLAGPDGEHFTVAIDDALRTAARRDRPRMGQLQIDIDGGLRPREVQSLIRAGGSTEEVADRAGWSVDKVRRYEGPILAERVHVADQARLVRVRHRGGSAAGATPTLQGRVGQRMRERGVDPDTSTWDAWRSPEASSWTVVLTFAAGGRQRQASWVYDPVLRSVEAIDDEARWLSADEVPASGPLPTSPPRAASVYDVEAEGGVAATTTRRATRERASGGPAAGESPEEPVDLMTAMRQRTTVGRRSGRRRAEPRAQVAPALPLDEAADSGEAALAGPPSAAHEPAKEPATEPALEPAKVSAPEPVTVGHVEPALPGELTDLEPAGSEVPPLDDEPELPAVPEVPEVPEDDDEPGNADADAEDNDAVDAPDTEAEAAPVETPRPSAAAKRKARTSVPSWDDIMFGAKRD